MATYYFCYLPGYDRHDIRYASSTASYIAVSTQWEQVEVGTQVYGRDVTITLPTVRSQYTHIIYNAGDGSLNVVYLITTICPNVGTTTTRYTATLDGIATLFANLGSGFQRRWSLNRYYYPLTATVEGYLTDVLTSEVDDSPLVYHTIGQYNFAITNMCIAVTLTAPLSTGGSMGTGFTQKPATVILTDEAGTVLTGYDALINYNTFVNAYPNRADLVKRAQWIPRGWIVLSSSYIYHDGPAYYRMAPVSDEFIWRSGGIPRTSGEFIALSVGRFTLKVNGQPALDLDRLSIAGRRYRAIVGYTQLIGLNAYLRLELMETLSGSTVQNAWTVALSLPEVIATTAEGVTEWWKGAASSMLTAASIGLGAVLSGGSLAPAAIALGSGILSTTIRTADATPKTVGQGAGALYAYSAEIPWIEMGYTSITDQAAARWTNYYRANGVAGSWVLEGTTTDNTNPDPLYTLPATQYFPMRGRLQLTATAPLSAVSAADIEDACNDVLADGVRIWRVARAAIGRTPNTI